MAAALSYPISGASAVTSISDFSTSSASRAQFGVMPSTQRSRNESIASVSRAIERSTLWAINGLKTFSSRCPCSPPMVTAIWLPMTCAQTIVTASHWVGLTLPGMIELPGSFSGSASSPSPERGPEPSSRRSLAILVSPTAMVLSTPDTSTIVSWVASASNLLGADTQGTPPVISASALTKSSPKPLGAFSPVPTAVPPCASRDSRGHSATMRSALSSSVCA